MMSLQSDALGEWVDWITLKVEELQKRQVRYIDCADRPEKQVAKISKTLLLKAKRLGNLVQKNAGNACQPRNLIGLEKTLEQRQFCKSFSDFHKVKSNQLEFLIRLSK